MVILLLCDLFRNLISVIPKISNDSFLLSKSIGKNKENTLEKPMLSWGQTEEPWYLNLPQREGKREMSDVFCLVSQTSLLSTPAWGQGEKLSGKSSPYTVWGVRQLNELPYTWRSWCQSHTVRRCGSQIGPPWFSFIPCSLMYLSWIVLGQRGIQKRIQKNIRQGS